MFVADLPLYKRLSGLRSHYLAKKIAPYVRDGSCVLDFGCGNMYTAMKLLEFRPELTITGVDIVADQNLDLEKMDPRLRFVQSSGLCCPFDDNTFDHVLALACLHHTDHPEKYLEELRRLIKAGGTIIIAEEMYINMLVNGTSRAAITCSISSRRVFPFRSISGLTAITSGCSGNLASKLQKGAACDYSPTLCITTSMYWRNGNDRDCGSLLRKKETRPLRHVPSPI